ncbi:uncharacterized protein V1510DRAFT_419133 [Dipodascopsis tothii]|uniref:uncharacterized protein n=1 Tax=Dipodascopsis tothii TaxID=44089 RepID=UPI0034CF6AAA
MSTGTEEYVPTHEEAVNPSNESRASSIASDDEDSAPLLRATTTNDMPFSSDPAAVAAAFNSDPDEVERGNYNPAQVKSVRWPLWKIATVAVAGLVGLIVFVRLVAYVISRRHEHPRGVCMTADCVHVAAGVLADADLTADPCTDFFQYTCGGWVAEHPLRSDQAETFTYTDMDKRARAKSLAILQAPFPGGDADDEAIFGKASAIYKACMAEDVMAARGVEPLYDLLEQLMVVYPLSASIERQTVAAWVHGAVGANGVKATVGAADLTSAMVFLEKLAVSALLEFSVEPDDKAPDNMVLKLYQIMNGLPSREYYLRADVLAEYTAAVKSVLANVLDAAAMGLSPSEADGRYSDLAKSVTDFEARMASYSLDLEDLYDPYGTYHPHTVPELQKLFPLLDFATFIDTMTESTHNPEFVLVTYPAYLTNLYATLDDLPRETLQTYFLWKIIEQYAGHVSSDALEPLTAFRNRLRGLDPATKPDRSEVCVNEVDRLAGYILGRYYVEAEFSPAAKELGNTIIYGIKAAFVNKLRTLEWMDPATRAVAIKKVNQLVQKVGYPEESPNILSSADLAKYYAGLEVTHETYFENYVSGLQTAVRDEWRALGQKSNRAEWEMSPSTVNAYYNPVFGEIVFPAAILQRPVFSVDQPSYMNFGAFGSVAGHELSHAFDNTGRQYDEFGVLHDWWTPSTAAEFEDRAQCFVKQYSEYTVTDENGRELHVNGVLTEGENIADNGGLAASFAAWKEYERIHPSQTLPGVNMTKEQLFFVSFGRYWCSAYRPSAAARRIYVDPHSPNFVRLLAGVSNSQDFINAFQCANKQPQCQLW